MGRLTVRHRTQRITVDPAQGLRARVRPDSVVVEEPLELRIGSAPLSVTMRTPGHDIEWLHGFLHAEGIICSAHDIVSARYCAGAVTAAETDTSVNTYNVIDVRLAEHVADPIAAGRSRSVLTSSACGVCGTATINDLAVRAAYDVRVDAVRIDAATILSLPATLRTAQATFERTGGLHAAGLFTAQGEAVVVREDVGRHNAVDKVIGWAVQRDLVPLTGHVLQVSGRASFELTQKAYLAGIPVLAAVSAPSSLAIETAAHAGMTLVGFVREASFNVYTGNDRIVSLPNTSEQHTPASIISI